MSSTRRPRSALLALLAVLLLATPAGPTEAQSSAQSREVMDQAYFFFEDATAFWDEEFRKLDLVYTPPSLYLIRAGLKVRSNCSGDAPDGYTWLGYPNEDGEGTQGLVDLFYCAAGGGYLDQTVLYTPVVYLSVPALIRDGVKVNTDDFDHVTAATVSHELGHDVQFQRYYKFIDSSPVTSEEDLTSRQIELSADCLAGVWADSVYDDGRMIGTDIVEAMVSQYYAADPEPLPEGTPGDHGTSQDRVDYWAMGFNSGDIELCDPSLIHR